MDMVDFGAQHTQEVCDGMNEYREPVKRGYLPVEIVENTHEEANKMGRSC